MVCMLIQLRELNVSVQKQDFAKNFGVEYVDGLESSLSIDDVLPDFDIHGELRATDGEGQMHLKRILDWFECRANPAIGDQGNSTPATT